MRQSKHYVSEGCAPRRAGVMLSGQGEPSCRRGSWGRDTLRVCSHACGSFSFSGFSEFCATGTEVFGDEVVFCLPVPMLPPDVPPTRVFCDG